MRVQAVIDVGSNSLKLLVVAIDGGSCRELVDIYEVTRLSEGLGLTGRLSEAAMARSAASLARFVQLARDLGAQRIDAVGTMALRSAANRDAFLTLVAGSCGLAIEVISGEKEAELSFLGAGEEWAEEADGIGVLDCGGQSTEFILGRQGRIIASWSLPVGTRQGKEAYLLSDPVQEEELQKLRDFLKRQFAVLAPSPSRLVGVGGTVHTLATVMLGRSVSSPSQLQHVILDRSEIERQIGLYRRLDLAARRLVPGLPPDRADVILAGAAVIAAAMDAVGAAFLTVSGRGLRYGLLYSRGETMPEP